MTLADDLIAAWESWDRAPGDRGTANRKEDAIRAAGLNGVRLHRRVAELRRAGRPLRDALATATEEQAQSPEDPR